MKHHTDTPHFLQFSLIGVFVISVLAVVGIVALVTSGGPALSTGGSLALAQDADANAAGLGIARETGTAVVYNGYSEIDNALSFSTKLLEFTVALDGTSKGTMVLDGKAYSVELAQKGGKLIAVDINADGSVDRKVEAGGVFILKK